MRVGVFGYAILEGKLEIGSGGAEPLFQSGWYYTCFVRDKLERYPQPNSPCLIIYLAGILHQILNASDVH